jgi:hypothetical protein
MALVQQVSQNRSFYGDTPLQVMGTTSLKPKNKEVTYG